MNIFWLLLMPTLDSLKLKSSIPQLEKGQSKSLIVLFATHGVPAVVKSDNGPPFFGEEFKAYMQNNGIKHQKITPLWPQANGEAESFMKPITKAIRSAQAEKRDWRKDLYRFLLNYRATPHSSTGISPAELLFNRKLSTKLPEVVEEEATADKELRAKDTEAKQKMKEQADKRVRAQQSSIATGDKVLVRQKKRNKFSTRFDPSPYVVVDVKGTMVTAVRDEKYITRNVSQFKRIDSSVRAPDADDSDDSDLSDDEEIIHENPDPAAVPAPRIPPSPPAQHRRYPVRQRNTSDTDRTYTQSENGPFSTLYLNKGRDVLFMLLIILFISQSCIHHNYVIHIKIVELPRVN